MDSRTMAKSVLVMVFFGLAYFSSAAPLKEALEDELPKHTVNTDLDQDSTTDTNTEKLSPTEKSQESVENNDVNKEVTNYNSIEIDGNSKVEETDNVPNEEKEEEPRLSEEDARELITELNNPTEVAQFIVAADDARGFLQALRLLTDQDYITLKMAYYLRDRVMDELRRMLMIQEMELSRTLLNNYGPADFTPEQLPNEPPAPYYDEFNTYVTQDELYPQVPYELYEESLRKENSRALAEIAEAVAQKIATGQLTSENGVKIMNTVTSLLPDSYWEDALDLIAGDDGYPVVLDSSEYSQTSDGSDVIEIINNDDSDEGAKSDDESEESQGYSEEEDANLENELRNQNLENVLEKQLVNKGHIKDSSRQLKEEDITDLDDTSSDNLGLVEVDEPELTEEDYQAFFDWLEKAMLDLPQKEGDAQDPAKTDDDAPSDKVSENTESNES